MISTYCKHLLLSILVLSLSVSCSSKIPSEEERQNTLNVISFNLRYNNPDDGENNWEHRKDRVLGAIEFWEPELLCTQEGLHDMLTYLDKHLKSYSFIGVGREDGVKKGEYSAIFYNTAKLQIQKQGYFWLSEDKDEPNKGWDAACERIATWAIFKDKRNNKEFFCLNTHLDHVGKVARQESIHLIKEQVKALHKDLPVLVCGDFNASPDSKIIQQMLTKDSDLYLQSSHTLSPVVYGPNWSFHDFGEISPQERPLIDYIFVNTGFKVSKYAVLADADPQLYLSDHAPVYAQVTF